MKSYKEIVEKIYEARKSHKEIVFPDSNEKEDEKKEMKEQAPVAPVPDRKYIKGTPEHKAYKATKKPINGMPTNVKEEADKKKEDDLPFTPDKPKKNPSAVPGKFGIGPSTAKHLAKMGMQMAMKKKAMKEEKDEQEYGYEGAMAITQLKTMMRHAEHMMGMMEEDTDLPEWVQSKITLATDYVQTAHDYLMSEMNEEVEDLEERNKENALKRKSMDASRGARFKAQGNFTPDPEPEHKTAQAHNKAVGRAIRQMSKEEVELDEKMHLSKAKMGDVIKDFQASDAPQFKGKSDEKKREMAIAAKLEADRGTRKEETEMLSYKEFISTLDEIKMADLPTRRVAGTYGTEYYKKEREKDEQGFDAKDDNQSTEKRGRGRPAGAKSGARGPRIK